MLALNPLSGGSDAHQKSERARFSEPKPQVFQDFSQRDGARGSAAATAADSDAEKYTPSGTMSFLFDKRTKKVINIVWGVVAIFVSLGMVIFFAPGLVNMFTA